MNRLVGAGQSERQVLITCGDENGSIWTLRQILHQLQPIVVVSTGAVYQHVGVVGTIENQKPLAVSSITQPVEYKLENVGIGTIATHQFDFVGNRLESFDDAGLRASMDPKYPFFSRVSRKPVGELDG
jgi:hypothetical protein